MYLITISKVNKIKKLMAHFQAVEPADSLISTGHSFSSICHTVCYMKSLKCAQNSFASPRISKKNTFKSLDTISDCTYFIINSPFLMFPVAL